MECWPVLLPESLASRTVRHGFHCKPTDHYSTIDVCDWSSDLLQRCFVSQKQDLIEARVSGPRNICNSIFRWSSVTYHSSNWACCCCKSSSCISCWLKFPKTGTSVVERIGCSVLISSRCEEWFSEDEEFEGDTDDMVEVEESEEGDEIRCCDQRITTKSSDGTNGLLFIIFAPGFPQDKMKFLRMTSGWN